MTGFRPKGLNYGELYFGDDEAQNKVIIDVASGLRTSPGKVHMVFGGRRSGKSTAIEKVIEGFDQDYTFTPATDPTIFFERKEFQALKRALLNFTNEAELDFQNELKIYTSASQPPHTVLVLHEEMCFPIQEEEFRAIMKAYKALPASIGSVSFVFDTPNEYQSLFPGIQTRLQKVESRDHDKCVAGIRRDYPDLEWHETAYDSTHIKESLWKAHQEGRHSVNQVRATMQNFKVDIKNPDVTALCKALGEKNREAYDLAFERLPTQGKKR